VSSNAPISLNKFCTAQTAIDILREQALRWNAPHTFDDPFELSAQSKLPFTSNDLVDAAVLEACAMIFSRESPRGTGSFVNAIRRWRSEERFHSQEEAEEVLKGLLPTMVNYHEEVIREVIADWRKFASALRICCFVYKSNSMPAWQIYGDHHRGVVLRFKCGDDSALTNPREMDYPNKRPEITTVKDQIGVMLAGSKHRPQDHFFEKFLTKAAVDKPEREWRCFREVGGEDLMADYLSVPFRDDELTGVFYGLQTALEDRQAIFDLVKEDYSKSKVYQAVALPGQYEIDYVRVTAKPES